MTSRLLFDLLFDERSAFGNEERRKSQTL